MQRVGGGLGSASLVSSLAAKHLARDSTSDMGLVPYPRQRPTSYGHRQRARFCAVTPVRALLRVLLGDDEGHSTARLIGGALFHYLGFSVQEATPSILPSVGVSLQPRATLASVLCAQSDMEEPPAVGAVFLTTILVLVSVPIRLSLLHWRHCRSIMVRTSAEVRPVCR